MKKLILIFGIFLAILIIPSVSSNRYDCTLDSDCVPEQCCHPVSCINKNYAPDCSGIFCTMECKEGTMDCGQGSCKCVEGKCKAVFKECSAGEIKYYTCPDGTQVEWCHCEDGKWACIISPEDKCIPESRTLLELLEDLWNWFIGLFS